MKSRRSWNLETLEDRTVPSLTITLVGSNLFIRGTPTPGVPGGSGLQVKATTANNQFTVKDRNTLIGYDSVQSNVAPGGPVRIGGNVSLTRVNNVAFDSDDTIGGSLRTVALDDVLGGPPTTGAGALQGVVLLGTTIGK